MTRFVLIPDWAANVGPAAEARPCPEQFARQLFWLPRDHPLRVQLWASSSATNGFLINRTYVLPDRNVQTLATILCHFRFESAAHRELRLKHHPRPAASSMGWRDYCS